MDVHHQQKSTPQASSGEISTITITPAYKGPRRLAFRIRRRGFTFEGSPSLLIINRHGVWSVAHRRYIRKTSYHRFRDLNKEPQSIIKDYKKLVRRVKINQWAQFKQEEELRSLRCKLADFYWAVMPDEVKARIVLFYRYRRQRQQQGRLSCFTAVVVLVAFEGFVLLSLVLIGCFSLRVRLFLGLSYLALVFMVDQAGVEYGL